jgi:peptidoglycan/xylan/chitin deacetylase (PgdA/CDA1 family)
MTKPGTKPGATIRSLLWVLAVALAACSPAPAPAPSSPAGSYPLALNSPAAFDRASRLEILAYAQALANAGSSASRTDVQGSKAAADRWTGWMLGFLRNNYLIARQSCASPQADLCADVGTDNMVFVAMAQHLGPGLPPDLAARYAEARPFYAALVVDQRQLASFFPAIATEIGTFNEYETNGIEFPDKTFQLSFDDGPTETGGNTDLLVQQLRQRDLHALFFLVGSKLDQRRHASTDQDLQQLYAGQCPASHGWIHQPHDATMPDWRESITNTRALLLELFPDAPSANLFRPPSGRRLAETSTLMHQLDGRVILWNIDSKDWNKDQPAGQIPARTLGLMLAWRHGIVLFHDIHPKVRTALPVILDATAGSGIQWQDCRTF